MPNVTTDADARRIAEDVATRERALAILRGSRSKSLIYALAPLLVACFVVGFGLAGLHVSFWPRVVISAGCILALAASVVIWRLQRQLLAAIDLLLLHEGKRY